MLITNHGDFPATEEYYLNVLCDTDTSIRDAIKANEQVGVDELVFMPLLPELDQLEHLTQLVR